MFAEVYLQDSFFVDEKPLGDAVGVRFVYGKFLYIRCVFREDVVGGIGFRRSVQWAFFFSFSLAFQK